MYFNEDEQVFFDEYLKKGYVVRPASDLKALNWINEKFIYLINKEIGLNLEDSPQDILNSIHERVSVSDLNDFRLNIIQGFNSIKGFREMYFRLARPYLEALVGNELAMQLRINLSIQFPGDDSSLLPVHADTWSGDSAFEVVLWVPLVDCYKTKTMYILPPKDSRKLSRNFIEKSGKNSDDLYSEIKKDIQWLDVKHGEILIFNQALPHGNCVNEESETRWSMNCRFKAVFTPYGDKKIGEFFEPITLRPASISGIEYQLPEIS